MRGTVDQDASPPPLSVRTVYTPEVYSIIHTDLPLSPASSAIARGLCIGSRTASVWGAASPVKKKHAGLVKQTVDIWGWLTWLNRPFPDLQRAHCCLLARVVCQILGDLGDIHVGIYPRPWTPSLGL